MKLGPFNVEVTKEHIENGSREHPDYDGPISLAVKESVKVQDEEVVFASVNMNNRKIFIHTRRKGETRTKVPGALLMVSEVTEFQKRFEAGKQCDPFSFDTSLVPHDYLKE